MTVRRDFLETSIKYSHKRSHGLTIYQVSAQSDVNCRSYPETKSLQTDGRTDAKGYNIMRPFFKRAYNKKEGDPILNMQN